MKIEERSNYADILKGIAIITVVMGHCGAKGYQIIYLFHMPIFFFISGYFYKEDYSSSPFSLLKKRLKSLYLPFIKYEFIFLVLNNLIYKIGIIDSTEKIYSFTSVAKSAVHIFLFDGTELLLAPFWFVTSLFIVNMLFCLISYCNRNFSFKESIRCITILVFFILGIYLTKMHINIKSSRYGSEIFNVSFVALLFFYIGFTYKKIEPKVPMNILTSITAFGILYHNSKLNYFIDMRTNSYPSISMFIVNALLGIYVMIYLSKEINRINFKFNLISYIGKNTLIILALHLTCFKLVGMLQIILYKLPFDNLNKFGVVAFIDNWWIAYTLVGVFIPLAIQYLFIDKARNITLRIRKTENITL
ncbi:O-acetyltransferase [Clostridium folliculivorans]|uniref:O-acetyltransferase n=1 Tax=Clostridium folliculivorans TaxID=2886038 RepID=A0A9W5Y630_9CLOT|nr:acyltransferase family protein [Clostridium folliculivorans]GKU27265.1 O-acetyltransferase [Clostridium folliculivorans]